MVDEVKRPPTMVEIASEQIEHAIFAGELRMGQPLRESQLMKEMNVSRGTVRQALAALQDKGLVDVVPHRGASVAQMNRFDVIETYTARSLIEPYAALVAFGQGALDDPVLLDHLKSLLEQMREAERSNDLEGISRSDVEFHFQLIKASGHSVLLSMFRTLLARTRLCIFQNLLLAGAPMSPNPHEHYEIVHAIENRAPDTLVQLLCEHSAKALGHFLSHQADVDAETMDYRDKLIEQVPWLRLVGAGTAEAKGPDPVDVGDEEEDD